MNIVSVASVAVVAADLSESRKLYVDVLGLPLTPHAGSDYWLQRAGCGRQALWGLAACRGDRGVLWAGELAGRSPCTAGVD